MQAFTNSFFLVFAGEMGDKTQLLALILAARFRRPMVILAAVFVATALNHGLAAWAGAFAAKWVDPNALKYILAATFFAFAVWILIPDKEGEVRATSHFGIFTTTLIAFFLAEMGDKTQLATIALGARYENLASVTMGTTMGMVASNALAVFFGETLLQRFPMKWLRRAASLLFTIFAITILIRGL